MASVVATLAYVRGVHYQILLWNFPKALYTFASLLSISLSIFALEGMMMPG
ncbi:hypothetical protein LOAG_15285, partial [Loa loa]